MRWFGSLVLCIALVASAQRGSEEGKTESEGECRRELRERMLQWERERESLVQDRDDLARSCGAALQSVEDNRKASDSLIDQQKALLQAGLTVVQKLKEDKEALRMERDALQLEIGALRMDRDAAARQRDALLLQTAVKGTETGSGTGEGGPSGGGLVPAKSREVFQELGVGAATFFAALLRTSIASMPVDSERPMEDVEQGRVCAARTNGHDNAALGDNEEARVLSDWATRMGITWGGWKLGDNGGGLRGAIVTAPIKQYSTIVSAPPSAVILTQVGDDSPLPDTFIHPNVWKNRLRSWWNIKLTLRLIYEKRLGPDSLWAPYIATIPERFSNLLWFTDEQLEELQYRPLIQKARNERYLLESVAKRIAQGMPEPITQDEFFWGLAAVQSRSYGADFGGGRVFHFMSPLSDAINHDDSSFIGMAWNHDLGQLELRTPYARNVGDNLYVSYGNYSNQILLFSYGFILEKNQFDYVPVFEDDVLRVHGKSDDLEVKNRILRYLIHSNALGLTLPLAHLRDKSRIFQAKNADVEELKVLGVGNAEMKMGGTNSEEDALLLYCRVMSLDRKQQRMGALRIARRLQHMKPLSAANERRAVLLLIRILHDQEASMRTSLEEDLEMMRTLVPGPAVAGGGQEPSLNFLNALRFRAQRKLMIRASVQRLRGRLAGEAAL